MLDKMTVINKKEEHMKAAKKQKTVVGDLSNKKEALDRALLNIEKQYGKGAIMKMDGKNIASMPVISTGILPLDIVLGVGGVPCGRIVEIYGPESSGKTTLTLNIIAQAQRNGGMAAFIDAEHALDPSYAKKLGVDVDELLVAQPDSGEQALEITEELVRSNALDIIVIDSVAALVPRSELEGNMGDAQVGVQARLMSQALRKLTGVIHKTNTIIIFINQIRMKIGVMFGSPETTTGGNALKFYSSIRMDIRKRETLMKGDVPIGNRVKVKVVKNKVAPPFKVTEFDIMFNSGISREALLIDVGANAEIVKKSGTWYSYGETRLGQGKENSRQFLIENPKMANEIEYKIYIFHDLNTEKLAYKPSEKERLENEKKDKEDESSPSNDSDENNSSTNSTPEM